MTLQVWTAASSDLIGKTFGASLKLFRPNVPEHKFVSWLNAEEEPPMPAAGGVVLVCGLKPLEVLRRVGLAPKNRTVSSLRENPLKASSGGWFLQTFDPAIIGTEPDKKEVIDWDVRLAVRLMTTGSMKPILGDYKWVNSYQPMIERIKKRFQETGKAVDVAMDTETMTFYSWYPDRDIVSISFTDEPGRSELLYTGPLNAPIAIDPTTPLFDQIKWLLQSPKVKLRGANLKYDLIWIAEKWGLECTNFKFDTMLCGAQSG